MVAFDLSGRSGSDFSGEREEDFVLFSEFVGDEVFLVRDEELEIVFVFFHSPVVSFEAEAFSWFWHAAFNLHQ